MHTTYAKKLVGHSGRARRAGRFGLVGSLAALTASLLMAQQKTPDAPAAAPPAAKAAAVAPTPAPAAPPAAQGPYTAPEDIVFKRIEIHAGVLSNVKGGTWKAPKMKSVTIQAYVITTSDPLPIGKKGVLFRKVETPGGGVDAVKWVKIADVTLKKSDASNKMVLDVDSEEKDVLIDGKKADHFAKNVKVKVQIDVEVKQ
jgi:hypothetical protein